MIESRWTEAQLSTIAEMLKLGKSYNDIAYEMHSTKNAIVGVVWRKKLRSLRPPPPSKPAKKPTNYRILAQPKKLKVSKPLPYEMPVAHRLAVWPPTHGFCQNIIGEALAHPPLCCGLPVVQERSYCAQHCAANYTPNPNRTL